MLPTILSDVFRQVSFLLNESSNETSNMFLPYWGCQRLPPSPSVVLRLIPQWVIHLSIASKKSLGGCFYWRRLHFRALSVHSTCLGKPGWQLWWVFRRIPRGVQNCTLPVCVLRRLSCVNCRPCWDKHVWKLKKETYWSIFGGETFKQCETHANVHCIYAPYMECGTNIRTLILASLMPWNRIVCRFFSIFYTCIDFARYFSVSR